MRKCRILFEKTGKAIYISHLDLMHTIERIFLRAEVKIAHTQGFNPHPKMVFAMPMSLGTESICELLDIELEDDAESLETIPGRLNAKSPDGIIFKKAYESGRKFKDIAYLYAEGELIYDGGLPNGIIEKLDDFFNQDEIVIKKKTKKGIADTDIKPGIKEIVFKRASDNTVLAYVTVTSQNPTTNPGLIVSALNEKRPDLAPNFSQFKRVEMLDVNLNVFI